MKLLNECLLLSLFSLLAFGCSGSHVGNPIRDSDSVASISQVSTPHEVLLYQKIESKFSLSIPTDAPLEAFTIEITATNIESGQVFAFQNSFSGFTLNLVDSELEFEGGPYVSEDGSYEVQVCILTISFDICESSDHLTQVSDQSLGERIGINLIHEGGNGFSVEMLPLDPVEVPLDRVMFCVKGLSLEFESCRPLDPEELNFILPEIGVRKTVIMDWELLAGRYEAYVSFKTQSGSLHQWIFSDSTKFEMP